MVVNNSGLNLMKTGALNTFDSYTHIAYGTGTTTPVISQTALVSEGYRQEFESSNKDTTNYEYEFTGRIPISEFNTGTLSELGVFSASSGGDMALRELYESDFTKTADDEIITKVRVVVTASNS